MVPGLASKLDANSGDKQSNARRDRERQSDRESGSVEWLGSTSGDLQEVIMRIADIKTPRNAKAFNLCRLEQENHPRSPRSLTVFCQEFAHCGRIRKQPVSRTGGRGKMGGWVRLKR